MIRIGLLATLVGPFQLMGEDGVRGAQLALDEFDHNAAGEPVELVVRATNAIASSATDAAIELLRDENCSLIVGPLAGDEGEAIRDFAREHPGHSFINGTSASQAIFNTVPNFFAFSGSGVQWMAGLGRYCYDVRNYRRVATIGQGYSFPFAQVGGFALEFCRAGGDVSPMVWSGLGTDDFSPYVDQIPEDVDAVLSVLAGPDSVAFVRAYRERGHDTPMIVGQAAGDIIPLELMRDHGDWLVGTLMAGPSVYANPAALWGDFVETYRAHFPDGHYVPSFYAIAYYVATKAALLALETVEGDLPDDQQYFQAALADLRFEVPTGPVWLDAHHLAVVNNFVGQVDRSEDGALVARWLATVPEINCTLGLPEDEYMRIGNFSARNMPCGPDAQGGDSFFDRLQQQRRNRPQS